MKNDFNFSRPTSGPLTFSMSSDGWQTALSDEGIPVLKCDAGCTIYQQREIDMLHAIRCWNACAGLVLPENIRPGILAELVTAARSLVKARADSNAAVSRIGTPDHVSGDPSACARAENEIEDRVAAILANLSDPAPPLPRPLQDLAERAEANAAEVLMKWHNWVATGQLAFKPEHLAESFEVLKAAGLPAIEPDDVEPVSPWTEQPTEPGTYWERRHNGSRIVTLQEYNFPVSTWQQRRDSTVAACDTEEGKAGLAALPESAWRVEYSGPLNPPA